MARLPTLTQTLYADTSAQLTFELVDEQNQALALETLETLTLTAYELESEDILNAREGQDVLNANDVTVVTDAGPPLVTTVSWLLTPADTAMLDPERTAEYHVAQFVWTWSGGTRRQAYAVQYAVEALAY